MNKAEQNVLDSQADELKEALEQVNVLTKALGRAKRELKTVRDELATIKSQLYDVVSALG